MRTNSNDPQDQDATAAWYQSESEKQLKELLALQGKMARQLRSEGIPAGDMPEDDEEAIEPTEEELTSSGMQGSGRKGMNMPMDEEAIEPMDEEMDDEEAIEPTDEELKTSGRNKARRSSGRPDSGMKSRQGNPRMGAKGMPMARNKRNMIDGGRSGDMSGDAEPDAPMSRDELMKRMFGGVSKPKKGRDAKRPRPEEY
jgi:hypothetical protein